MILDLRPGTPLEKEQADRLAGMTAALSADFHEFLRRMASQNDLTDEDWLSRIFCRNTIYNGLYERFGRLKLLHALIAEGDIPAAIIVDSMAFRDTVIGVLPPYMGAAIRVERRDPPHHMKAAFKSVLRLMVRWFCARVLAPPRSPAPTRPLTVLDTFVLPASFPNGRDYADRYWGNLWQAMTPQEAADAAYLPTLVGHRRLKEFAGAFRAMRASPRHFLVREDELTLGDYVYALRAAWRIPRRDLHIPAFDGLDVAGVVREEGRTESCSIGLVDALLTIRHLARLKARGARLRLVLDWFEAQPVDRALCIAMARSFPDVPVTAYCGAIMPDEELSIRPADYELQAGAVPKRFAVTGPGFIPRTRHFAPFVDIAVAPALRHQEVLEKRTRAPDAAFFTLLAALPIDLPAARAIIVMLQNMPVRPGTRIWLKGHPALRADALGNRDTESMTFVTGSFNERLEESNAVLSAASVACLEALLRGVPVIVAANRNGFTRNPIPVALRHLAPVCASGDELAHALDSLPSATELEMIARKHRGDYFSPCARETMRALLALD